MEKGLIVATAIGGYLMGIATVTLSWWWFIISVVFTIGCGFLLATSIATIKTRLWYFQKSSKEYFHKLVRNNIVP